MYRLVFIGSDLLSAGVILVPLVLVLTATLWKGSPPLRRGILLLFSLYAVAVYSAVGLPSIAGITVDPDVNWIPFLDGLSDPLSYGKNFLLNALLFLPFGFLLPVLWASHRCGKAVVGFGFGLSLCIEVLQLCNLRLTDVDDLIANTLGTLLGYLLFLCLSRGGQDRLALSPGPAKGPGPAALCALSFLVVFLLLPFLPSLADVLYTT